MWRTDGTGTDMYATPVQRCAHQSPPVCGYRKDGKAHEGGPEKSDKAQEDVGIPPCTRPFDRLPHERAQECVLG